MEERIKALEEELHETTEGLKEILLDIRSFLMEAQNPLRGQANAGNVVSKVTEGRG